MWIQNRVDQPFFESKNDDRMSTSIELIKESYVAIGKPQQTSSILRDSCKIEPFPFHDKLTPRLSVHKIPSPFVISKEPVKPFVPSLASPYSSMDIRSVIYGEFKTQMKARGCFSELEQIRLLTELVKEMDKVYDSEKRAMDYMMLKTTFDGDQPGSLASEILSEILSLR